MKYKLFHGDCIEVMQSQDFQGLIQNRQVIFVSDPPFNVGYHYNTYSDNKSETEYFEWLKNIFENFPFVIIHYPESIYKLALTMNRVPEKVVSWVYNANTPKQHRDIAFFGVEPDFKKVYQPYKNPNDKRIAERIANGARGGRLYDWWEVNQVKNVSADKTNHPCQMPQTVMDRIIGILPDNILVVDPFMGSNTTGLACEKHNVDYIGIEIDNEYFETAKNRLENEVAQIKIWNL